MYKNFTYGTQNKTANPRGITLHVDTNFFPFSLTPYHFLTLSAFSSFYRCRNPGSIYKPVIDKGKGPKTSVNHMKEPTPQPNTLCFDYNGCTLSHKVISNAISSILKPVPGAKIDNIQVRT